MISRPITTPGSRQAGSIAAAQAGWGQSAPWAHGRIGHSPRQRQPNIHCAGMALFAPPYDFTVWRHARLQSPVHSHPRGAYKIPADAARRRPGLFDVAKVPILGGVPIDYFSCEEAEKPGVLPFVRSPSRTEWNLACTPDVLRSSHSAVSCRVSLGRPGGKAAPRSAPLPPARRWRPAW